MMNNFFLFEASSKMADLILADYRILTLLPRFGIKLGFGEKTILEVCRKYNVDVDFFLMVCNIHIFDNYLPDEDELIGLDVDSVIGYLMKSHEYYIDYRMASVERKLHEMCNSAEGSHYEIIAKFFCEYKEEVLNHFNYENVVVFPGVRKLAKDGRLCFHIEQYEKNHTNIDDKLNDLKNILIKYMPEDYSDMVRNNILLDIFEFEEDLTKHTRIEDKVLIPYVRNIEKCYEL